MANSQTIDRSSYEPAYIQLVNIIRQQVASGEFLNGAKLPSESQLCRTHKISPMTVRRAINLLVDQGVVVTAQGKGTFVQSLDLAKSSFSLDNLLTLLKNSSNDSVDLLGVDLVLANRTVSKKLSVKVNERAVFIKRLIKHNSQPAILHNEYLVYDPKRPIVEAEMEVTRLMGLLEGKGEEALKKGHFMIEAAVLDGEEAKLLQTPEHFPAFRLEHTFYGYGDQPMSWGWFLARGDRLHFTAEIGIWE